ncbi:DUF3807 domain-containing protein [Aspergillus clavatus NRRL 1]|uniref:Uncharacterized protein n=1 Tax=Aspergillus clavatus (strain ATCC 1007 / CBS 513.65 / DSM 816 / NCTC 3887 / NRRL 1 / QM 1276 / 107) TaxID=344612 RepID=A1C451_ASPCL|nr:uncharacterized protein ACLA_058530 [Aspergillus clavatus NRRL 1]EAW15191.1 conserved hypothetical protein [Aspergillus clavatus NRRL 1]
MPDSQLPIVTFEDLQAFQAKHFPTSTQVTSFDHNHNQTVDDEYYEEDDGLGYYPDGVKRTLTDEQIEIFRHSEIHTLLRERELREEALAEELRDMEAEQQAGDIISVSNGDSVPDVAGRESGMSQGDEGAGESKQHNAHDASGKESGKTRPGETLDYSEDGARPRETYTSTQFTGRKIISYDD